MKITNAKKVNKLGKFSGSSKGQVSNARKKINAINEKYKHGYLMKLWIFRSIICITILVIAFIVISKIKWNIDVNEDNLAKIDSKKYTAEILSMYEREDEEEKFLSNMKNIEENLASYLILNTTTDKNSFNKLVKELNGILNGNDWSKINLEKNTYYNGKYYLDEKGNLTFRFDNKSIEPSWTKNINKYIKFN